MKTVSIEVLERVYNNLEIDYPINDLLSALQVEQDRINDENNKEIERERLAKEEESKKIWIENVREKLPEEHKDCVEDYIDELVEEMEWWDVFYDYDGMDDDGDDTSEYFLIGDKLYLVDIHCEAEWVGDWSVRKNLPGDVSVQAVHEVDGFTIIEGLVKDGESVQVKLK
jgi:hypothetical protein